MIKIFNINIEDYDPGTDPDPLTAARLEAVIQKMLDKDGSDGVVIVAEGTVE